MEGILRVTPEKLISTADEFQTTGGQVRNMTQEMLGIVDSLKSSWEGDAAIAYNTKFHQLEDDMERMHRMIDEHVKDLKEMATQYRTAENDNTEMGNDLRGDVIS
ncbi:MAG: WXG100 family type VII secretion target [Lachnospiraceae bacterium]|nr:WXG100 family type VII secretion target [Lachnospiraceae bacterium]